MFERRPSPSIVVIGGLIACVSAWLILTGGVWSAAIAAGFVPLRTTGNVASIEGFAPFVPVWLTPITAAFIHDGWLHLGFNLLTLAIVGTPTQRAVGLRGVLVLLLVGAYASVAAQWLAGPTSPAPMIGASGAISALIGAYALLFGGGKAKAIGPVPAHVVHAVSLGISWTLLNLAIGWASAGGDMPVAGAAHAGGFIAGMVLLRPLLWWRWGGAAGGGNRLSRGNRSLSTPARLLRACREPTSRRGCPKPASSRRTLLDRPEAARTKRDSSNQTG